MVYVDKPWGWVLETLDRREREVCCLDSSVSRLYTLSAFMEGGVREGEERRV